MKYQELRPWIQLLLTPVLMILLGLILIFRPDSASALVARVLGYGLVLIGIGFGISAIFARDGLTGKVVSSLVCVIIGGWLLKNPLRLAAGIGRVVGILVALRGFQDVQDCIRLQRSVLFALLTVLVGILLIVLPMTASRLVMLLCGLAVLVLGGVILLDRLRFRNRIDPPDNDIIDAL